MSRLCSRSDLSAAPVTARASRGTGALCISMMCLLVGCSSLSGPTLFDPVDTGEDKVIPKTDSEPEPVDTDTDGVADEEDNCPDDRNPNQLDFDGNGLGNVCDPMTFTTVSGTVASTASVGVPLVGSCAIPFTLTADTAEVQVQLDDDAALVALEVTSLGFEDAPTRLCELNVVVDIDVTLADLLLTNRAGALPVSFPSRAKSHDTGELEGTTTSDHPVTGSATLALTAVGVSSPGVALALDGALPPFVAALDATGPELRLTFTDSKVALLSDTIGITEPIEANAAFELTGLVGTLTLTP